MTTPHRSAAGLTNAQKLKLKLEQTKGNGQPDQAFIPPKGMNAIEDGDKIIAYHDTIHHRWLWEDGKPFTDEQAAVIEAWEQDDPESPHVGDDAPPFHAARTAEK